MLMDSVEVVRKGDSNGNGMLIRIQLPSGIEILGLPTENAYGGGWDLGPTWNYLVLDDKPFLVDTGRLGMGQKLLDMIAYTGMSASDIAFIMASHGHEDHDGSLYEMATSIQAPVKGHLIYDRLIRYYPDLASTPTQEKFPALCWRCFMPESYSDKNCREYQETRSRLTIETLKNEPEPLSKNTLAHHVPGHSPDALAIFVGEEALLVGDTVLPDITPWPSQEAFYHPVKRILSPEYPTADSVFGLRAYLRSLKTLKALGSQREGLMVLPAHRLFYGNRWNDLDLTTRIDELIEHHIQRCGAILEILKEGPKTVRDLSVHHFDAPLLKGFGILMAENEMISHCELLEACGDVQTSTGGEYRATGHINFESAIGSLTSVR
ncbi:MAG: MBL fold metallo-hydrolase [Deltaproteobacteria bacterium]|nr:MBL fold metallo-hydrolase [Deltaproteobacteria bacterium]